MVSKKIIDKFSARAYAQKRITVKRDELNATVGNLFNFIDYVNGSGEFDRLFREVENDVVEIPKEFSAFIMPFEVKWSSVEFRSKDLLIHATNSANPYSSYLDFLNDCDLFRSYFKKDVSSDMVKVIDVHKSVNLTDVIDRASSVIAGNNLCHDNSSAYVPIPIDLVSKLFKDTYFNSTVDDMVDRYLSTLNF